MVSTHWQSFVEHVEAQRRPLPAFVVREVVEDDRGVARSLSRVLRRRGAEVRTVGIVAEGIATLREQRPDAILLDMLLPDGTGHDVLAELAGELTTVQVIVMTGYAEADALHRVRELGLPVLAKPFDPAEVAARLGLHDD